MAREKMRIGWEQIVVDGEPMYELVSVDGVAAPEDLPNEYTAGPEYVDYSEKNNGIYVFGDVSKLHLPRLFVVGSRVTYIQHKMLVHFLNRCASDLRIIDGDIAVKEKRLAGWSGPYVDEI